MEILAALEEEALRILQLLQRVLQTVIDHPQNAGPQCDGEKLSREFHLIPHHHSGRALENLHIDLPAADPDHFRFERHPLTLDECHLVLKNLPTLLYLAGCQRTVHRDNATLGMTAHVQPPPYKKLFMS